MSENYKEAFEKTRSAGIIASGALDEVAKVVKPGTRTDKIDKLQGSTASIMKIKADKRFRFMPRL